MTLLRPKVNPSDIFLTGETAKFVRADGQMATPAGTDISGVEADISALQSDMSTAQTNITNLQTEDTSQDTELSDHETRITALEGAGDTSNLLASDFSASTVTGTTSITTLGTVTLPANSVPAPGEAVLRAWGTWTTSSGTFAHAGPLFTLYFAGSVIGTGVAPIGDNSQTWPWEIVCRLVNTTSTSNQQVTTNFVVMGDGFFTDAGASVGVSSSFRVHHFLDYQTATVDTTANRTFELKVTPSTSGDHCTRAGFMLSLESS